MYLRNGGSGKGMVTKMKKNWWKLGVAMGIALMVMAGNCRLDAAAAEAKEGERETGKSSVVKTARQIPIDVSLKMVLGTEAVNKAAEGPGTGDGIKYIENGENAENGTDGLEAESPENNEAIKTSDAAVNENEGAEEGSTPEEGAVAVEENAEEIDAYFDDSVFVGDSIMLGFRNYAMKRQDTFLSRMGFLAAGSFSANNALWEVGGESVHPVFQGEQRQIWESISLMGSRRAFIMLGMNDLNITGLDGTCEIYEELIGKIKEANPEVEIHIMSMTYILKGKEAGKLNNDTIREYNGMLKAMAEENGWGYVDVANALADGNGDLAEEYCSDGFAHQNPEAYDVWVSVLREYAGEHL